MPASKDYAAVSVSNDMHKKAISSHNVPRLSVSAFALTPTGAAGHEYFI